MDKKKEKHTPTPQEEGVGVKYRIVGLQKQDKMPVTFRGRKFDFANLSKEEVEFLLQEKCSFIKKG